MILTARDLYDEKEQTSERVAFMCSGCGRDTVIHVGSKSLLTDKRCFSCQGTDRFGRTLPSVRGRQGTHQGSLKTAERRAIKRAASLRNARRRSGYRMANGETGRMPCRSYDECNHRKHRVAKGLRAR